MNSDRTLKTRSRRLHKEQTPAETQPWRELRNRRFVGYKFRRQHAIGPYMADFYYHDAGLIVELDGESHFGRDGYDRKRQEWLES